MAGAMATPVVTRLIVPGVTKLVIVVGSGLGGLMLIEKNKLVEFLGDLSKVFSKHFKEGEQGEKGGEGGGSESALSLQVKRLTQEIRSLPSSALTVVQAGSGSEVSITAFFLPVAVLGALSYGCMKWRGYSFTDIMYVTRKGMNEAVASVGKQLENVSATLSSTRRHMNQRMDAVNTKLDDSIVMTGLIKDQVEDVKSTVRRSSRDIENMSMKLEELGLKIEEVQDSQNFANQGISLLIEWAHRLNVIGPNQQAELSPGFKSWYQKAITLEKTSKFGGAFTSPGLKQLLSDALEPPPVNSLLEIAPATMNTVESRPPGLNLASPDMSRTLSAAVLSRSDLRRGLSGT